MVCYGAQPEPIAHQCLKNSMGPTGSDNWISSGNGLDEQPAYHKYRNIALLRNEFYGKRACSNCMQLPASGALNI